MKYKLKLDSKYSTECVYLLVDDWFYAYLMLDYLSPLSIVSHESVTRSRTNAKYKFQVTRLGRSLVEKERLKIIC